MKEDRIKEKIEYLEKFLDELSRTIPLTFEEYAKNFQAKAACERYFEKITSSIADIAFLIVKENNLKKPEYEQEVFKILSDSNIISEKLGIKLKEAKGMRNIIAHEYGEIDDELVFESLTQEIIQDAEEFLDSIKNSKK